MILITPEEQVSQTAELLHSLQRSIRNLRRQVEDLKTQIQTGEEVDLARSSKEVAAVETLARTCQRVEASLVEQCNRQAGIVRGGIAIDMEQARFEIGCRLARLRACNGAGEIPE